MDVIFKPFEVAKSSPRTLSDDFSLLEAGKRGLHRTLQALFRENLLFKENLIVEGSTAWLPLWSQQGLLRFDGLQMGGIGSCQLSGSISYYKKGEQPQPVPTASALLSCVAQSLPGRTAGNDLQRLLRELDNSMANDALCLKYRRSWAQQLIIEFGTERLCFIASVRNSALSNPALLLEQWGTLGHPWHPTYKTKLGLTADEVVEFSPEFQPVFQVPIAAIKSDNAHVAFAEEGGNYRHWFAQTFPQSWAKWEASMHQRQQDPGVWLPLPLHPYQAQHWIEQKFATEIMKGELMLLPDVSLAASPTMSFRTVVPEGSAQMPHMKLPVSLRLTTAQRTLSPKSAVMGPRLTRLLTTIVNRESGFGGTLDILAEDVGLHYVDPDRNDDRAKHLAVLFRANPMSKCTGALFPVPVGSLFAESPLNERPIVTDLVSLSFSDCPQGAEQFLERYAKTILTAALGAYLVYGIAFEAHQQNSFIMVNERYEPTQLLVRDFGDLRVHGPTLRITGLDLVPYRTGQTVLESDEPVRDKLLHAVMLCHLGEIALLLSRTYNHPESIFWNILRRETEVVFDRLRERTNPQRWQTEHHALLENDWPAKSLLRMRLTDTSDAVHCHMPNPLKMAVL